MTTRMAVACLALATALPLYARNAATAVATNPSGTVLARVAALVNEARARPRRCGNEEFGPAPPLSPSGALQDAAREHADDMARRRYFDHRGSDGSAPRDRVVHAGYAFLLTGENIAYGPESAEEVVAGWLASPGHCANIMDPRFADMGLALAIESRRGAVYWVQVLGEPRSGGTAGHHDTHQQHADEHGH